MMTISPWLKTMTNQHDVAWLAAFREQQWNLFLEKGLPTKKDERFKYTDFSKLLTQNFTAAKADSFTSLEKIVQSYRLSIKNHIQLVFVNGFFLPEFSIVSPLPKGVLALNLKQAIVKYPELIKNAWPLPIFYEHYPFARLNAATFTDGLFLYLSKGCKLKTPLHILHLATGEEVSVAHPHHLIIQSEESELTLIEEFQANTTTKYWRNVVTHIDLHNNAKLEYVKIQNENSQSFHTAHTFVQQNENTQLTYTDFSSGGFFARDDLVIRLQKPGAICQTNGFYHLTTESQYLDHHIDIQHNALCTQSEMLYKGIVAQKGCAVFNGRLYVAPLAQKITAYQANHNLLLAKDAEVYSKPELEIYTDDVKCKHGASTGQMNEEALFYLCSRGISRDCAIYILLHAFADEIINRISHPEIKMHVLKGAKI